MISLILSSVTLIASQPAEARPPQPGHEPISVRVEYSDLNLERAAGQAELRRRLDRATAMACPIDAARDLRTHAHANSCRKKARSFAAREVDRVLALRSEPAGQATKVAQSNGGL